jgi:hypothetical protein
MRRPGSTLSIPSESINEWAAAYDGDQVDERWPTDEAYAADGERLAALAAAELGRRVVYDD